MNTDQINKFAPRTGTGIFLAIVVVAFIPVILNAFPMLANLFYLYGHLIGMTLAGFVARLAPVYMVFVMLTGFAMMFTAGWIVFLSRRYPQERILDYGIAAGLVVLALMFLHYATLLQSQL